MLCACHSVQYFLVCCMRISAIPLSCRDLLYHPELVFYWPYFIVKFNCFHWKQGNPTIRKDKSSSTFIYGEYISQTKWPIIDDIIFTWSPACIATVLIFQFSFHFQTMTVSLPSVLVWGIILHLGTLFSHFALSPIHIFKQTNHN